MIREHTIMTPDTPSTEAKSGLNAGKIAVVLAIGVAVAAFFYFDLGRFLSLQALKDNRDDLLSFTETHAAAAAALFVLAYVAVTGLSLPGAVILTLAGGFLFGVLWGTLFVNRGGDDGRDARVSRIPLLAARLGGTEVWKVVGPGSAGLYEQCVQLSPDSPADSALSVLCGKSGIRPDSHERRHLCRGDGTRDYPWFLRLCLRGSATRYDQFLERYCVSRRDWGICVAGASGACAKLCTRSGLGNRHDP